MTEESKAATAFLAKEMLLITLGMLRHPSCPIKDWNEAAKVGSNAMLSACITLLVDCGASMAGVSAYLRDTATSLDEGRFDVLAVPVPAPAEAE